MVENYLGEETFRKGVHAYLSAHEYGNATAEDFWNAQTAASHKPVDKIMESFVAQQGEPVLTFGPISEGLVLVDQHRFYLSPGIRPDPAQKWTIPVCLRTAEGPSCDLLTPETSGLPPPLDPLFFANEGEGYYRSMYAPNKYAKLVAHAESSLLPVERISLAVNEWAQVYANKATVAIILISSLLSSPTRARKFFRRRGKDCNHRGQSGFDKGRARRTGGVG